MPTLEYPPEFEDSKFLHWFLSGRNNRIGISEYSRPPLPTTPIRIQITDAYALYFGFIEGFIHTYGITLSFEHPSAEESYELARDIFVASSPYLFRWQEVLDLSMYAAKHYDNVDHPDVLFILLMQFSAITPDDDLEHIHAMMSAALEKHSWVTFAKWISGNVWPLIEHYPENLLDEAKATDERWAHWWVEHEMFGWILQGAMDFGCARTPIHLSNGNEDRGKSNFPREHFHRMLVIAAANSSDKYSTE